MYSYTAIGRGAFPHAIMAAEGATPATPSDSEAIASTSQHERRISLESPQQPNKQRWSGAGWMIRNFIEDHQRILSGASDADRTE